MAIQQDRPFGEKLFLICEGLNQLMRSGGLTTIAIKKHSGWEVTQSKTLLKHVQAGRVDDPEMIAYYKRCLALKEIMVFDNTNQMTVPKLYGQLMEKNEFNQYPVIPLQKVDDEKIGSIIFYFADELGEEELYEQMLKKVIDLILLVVSYEEKQQEIYRLACTDLPTGMINQYGFIEQVNASGITNGELHIIEPTEFSRVIEVYGRDTGEQLLRAIYERLSRSIEKNLFT